MAGVGALGSVIAGAVTLGEPVSVSRIVLIALILIGVVGLRLSAPA